MTNSAPQHGNGDSIPPGGDAAVLEKGGFVPGMQHPAFTLARPAADGLPVLIAVPHAGRAYPPSLLHRLRHGETAAHRLEDRHVDLIGRAAAPSGASLLVAHAPRAMIDLNRDGADLDPGMFRGAVPIPRAAPHGDMPRQQPRAPRGLGLFPRRLTGLGELWRLPMEAHEADERIEGVHAPYHDCLSAELHRLRAAHGFAVLIDLHSMPSLPRRGAQPPITHVVGDRFGASCAASIAAAAVGLIEHDGEACAYNRPYAGGYVLDRHGRPRRDIHAIQLEIDRAGYLDDRGRPRPDRVAALGDRVGRLATLLAGVLKTGDSWSGQDWGLSDAAE